MTQVTGERHHHEENDERHRGSEMKIAVELDVRAPAWETRAECVE